MCGIIGVASPAPINNLHQILTLGCDALIHRGPDSGGIWIAKDHRIGLGHRRLSIIDLSPAGHQPLCDTSENFYITFNGEIYNFQDLRQKLESKGYIFNSFSDTEVVLTAYREWGAECVNRFVGMFAFAIFDVQQRRLFIARDRAGEKPLFYRFYQGRLTFASELKALLADPTFPRKVNRTALDTYLAYGYVPGELCILDGVYKLPPAHALVFDLQQGEMKTWKYWQLPEFEGNDSSEDELLEELEALLTNSVKSQLVADVPVGILLSGGVDSSLTTALAAQTVPQVKTFTIRFPGYGAYDETRYARLIANHFGTDHTELEADASTVSLLPTLARQFDEPIVDSSMIPTYLVSQLIRKHCTVALGGDGGDELFGGYGYYSQLLNLAAKLRAVPYPLRQGIASLATIFLPTGLKGRSWLKRLNIDFQHGSPISPPHFDGRERKQLLKNVEDGCLAESIWQQRQPQNDDLLQRATRMDFENYMPEDILVKVDRASMLNSLEIRAPWLDYRLIEFAFAKVPSYRKATSSQKKILPKKLAKKVLPPQFDLQRKQGFSIPLKDWLQNKEWLDYFKEILLDSSDCFFDHEFTQMLLKGQANGRANNERLFALVMFELWRQEYQISP